MNLIKEKNNKESPYQNESIEVKFKKIRPDLEDVIPVDKNVDLSTLLNSIGENFSNLSSNDDIVREASLIDLILFLRLNPATFQQYFDENILVAVLNIFNFKSEGDTLMAVNFLGFLTYFYDSFSERILNYEFIDLMTDVLSIIKSPLDLSKWCTLLANLFYDCQDFHLNDDSQFLIDLLSLPDELVCCEYIRLVTTLISKEVISDSISSKFLDKLISFFSPKFDAKIISASLKYLKQLFKTAKNVSLNYKLIPNLNILLDILQSKDIKIVKNDLKLIRNLLLNCNYVSDVFANNDRIYFVLADLLEIDNPELKCQILKTVNAFIESDSLFGEKEAMQLFSYDFKSDLAYLSFKSKIEIVNFERLLFHHLPNDIFIPILDDVFFDLISGLLESDHILAKINCYKFLIDLLYKINSNSELFKEIKSLLDSNGISSIAEIDASHQNQGIMELAQIYLNFMNENNIQNE